MRAVFHHAILRGIITLVPPRQIDIDSELHTIYKGDEKALARIKKVIGLQSRHVADTHITASDIGEQAANILLDSLHIPRDSIDALIFVTQTPDYILPASACYLHGRLGLSEQCASFDINQACSGYLYGLYMAHSLIESGGARRVLLLCGDTLSRYVNPLDSNLAPIIGDGVSASLLEYTPNDNPAYIELGAKGEKFYELIIPQGACRTPTPSIIPESKVFEVSNVRSLSDMYMDGAAIFNFAVMHYPKSFAQILAFAQIEAQDIDYFFFHQANKYIVDNIARALKLPKDKVPNTTTNKYGNLSGCSVPATICDTLGAEWAENGSTSGSKGANLDSIRATPLKIHLAGFGAGLAWGNAILGLDSLFFSKKVGVYNEGK